MTRPLTRGYVVSGMHRALLGLVTLVVLSADCGDQVGIVPPCSAVAVSVTRGTTPTFNWSSGCQIEELVVHLPGPGAVVWVSFSNNQTNSIAPPVTYGVFPPGAALTANLQQLLVAGTTYQVSLLRSDEAGGPLRSIGAATFVP